MGRIFSKAICGALVLLTQTTLGAVNRGGMESGGGNVIFCDDGITKTIELYDFFEAKLFNHADIQRTSESVDAQIINAIKKMEKVSDLAAYNLADYLRLVKSRITWLPDHIDLPPSNDFGTSNPVLVPEGCSLKGLAYYDSRHRLNIAKDLFDQMSPTDQAGLLLHEAAYFFTRTNGTDFSNPVPHSSEQVRDLIAKLFAKNLSVNAHDAAKLLFNEKSWAYHCALIGSCEPDNQMTATGHGIFEIPTLTKSVSIRYRTGTASVESIIQCYAYDAQLLWSIDAPENFEGEADVSQCRYIATKLGYSGDQILVNGSAYQISQGILIVGHP